MARPGEGKLTHKLLLGGLLLIAAVLVALAQQHGAITVLSLSIQPDSSIVDFIARFQSVLGALVGSLLTIAVSRRLGAERRRLEFSIARTENLTRALTVHHPQLIVSVKGQAFSTLNRSVIKVINTGNVSLKTVDFYIEIPGQHSAYLAEVVADDPDLTSSIKIATSNSGPAVNPVLHVVVEGFVNPREFFNVIAFFDGSTTDCKVRCRVADVKVKIKPIRVIALDDDIWP